MILKSRIPLNIFHKNTNKEILKEIFNKFLNSFHLKLEIVYKSYQRTEFFLYIWMVYPYYKKIFKL
ncbi:hypothetical protein LCGC14_1332680 [marine sediment metagenome]|uniref:Uncharacterized protein n=1 Tax=marine sediment metagenome TaxID=412755 RepID=A0A0F9KGT1_9ZZZZ